MLLTLSLQSLQFPVHFTNCKSYKLSIITRSFTETKKNPKDFTKRRRKRKKSESVNQALKPARYSSNILLLLIYDTQKLCSRLNYQRSQASGTLTHRFLCSHCKCAVQQQQQQLTGRRQPDELAKEQDKFPGQFRLLFCLRTVCR